MNEELIFASRRSVIYGTRGLVATSQPFAVMAGLQILAQGGNAADAAVAAAAALNVTEPTSTGIGGDAFALYYESASRQITALNGSGRSPDTLTLARLHDEGLGASLPAFHPYTVTVPGAAAAWCDLVARHGRLNLPAVLGPAIRMAAEGFPVAPITAYFWAQGLDRQLARAPNSEELTIGGRAPRAGEIFRNPGLARTLRAVAEGGKMPFYHGEIAASIVDVIQEAGGCMTLEDLAQHESVWVEPISTTYRNLRVWECPPNSQGLVALLALNILEGFDPAEFPPLSTGRLHRQIEALRLAFADGRRFVADQDKDPAPVDWLLSKAYAAQRRKLIDPHKANPHASQRTASAASDTVYLTVVDGEANACSFINSNYMGFGTGIVPKGWGFTLQNRGHNFSLDPAHPNALAPGKRPYHTIIPALATHTDDDSLYASFGVMGGFMQPQGHVQVFAALVDDGLDPQTALDQPRFYLQGGDPAGKLGLEEGISRSVVRELRAMGHAAEQISGHARAVFGRGQIILRDRETGVLAGGSDPRADGCALSL